MLGQEISKVTRKDMQSQYYGSHISVNNVEIVAFVAL